VNRGSRQGFEPLITLIFLIALIFLLVEIRENPCNQRFKGVRGFFNLGNFQILWIVVQDRDLNRWLRWFLNQDWRIL